MIVVSRTTKSASKMILLEIVFDHDAITCRNLNCKIYNNYINYLYECNIGICNRASDICLPRSSNSYTNNKESKVTPGWNDYVQPLFEKSLFWYDIWVQNRKTRAGHVANIMRLTRARYHYVVRNAIKSEDRLRNDKMTEAVGQKKDN